MCSTYPCGDGGPATSASFKAPTYLATDRAGDVVVSDPSAQVVRMIPDQAGTYYGVSMPVAGDIYTIAGKYGSTCSATTLAQARSSCGDGGPATSALLHNPEGIALDGSGNPYIADSADNVVREVNFATGIIDPVEGDYVYCVQGGLNSTWPVCGDGNTGTDSELASPTGLVIDSSNHLYVAESSTGDVREMTLGGKVSTLVNTSHTPCTSGSGSCGDGGYAYAAGLFAPQGLSMDAAGDLFITDAANHAIREVPTAGGTQYGITMSGPSPTNGPYIYTVAGSTTAANCYGGGSGACGDGGLAISAKLSNPHDVAVDSAGNLYIADASDNSVREVTLSGSSWDMELFAGNSTYSSCADAGSSACGDGSSPVGSGVKLDGPNGVALGPGGTLYVADSKDFVVRQVQGVADPPALAGSQPPPDGGPLTPAQDPGPYDRTRPASPRLKSWACGPCSVIRQANRLGLVDLSETVVAPRPNYAWRALLAEHRR